MLVCVHASALFTHEFMCVPVGMSNPSLRTQSSNEKEEESLDRVKNLGKQKELITQERDLPEKPYNHVNISEMR